VGGDEVTHREALIFVLISVAMIATGLTWIFGPWALFGTGLSVLIGVPLLVDEREEDKPDG
jgi:hypothetical protein